MSRISSIIKDSFNDIYPKRPVWALASTGTSSSMNQPVVASFAEDNPYNAIAVEFSGNARSRSRQFADEMANQNMTFYGNTAVPSYTSGRSPTSGIGGITSISNQTSCLHDFEMFDNGNYGWYGASSSTADQAAGRAGIIVGESNWRQCYDLFLDTGGTLYKDEIGGVWNSVTGSNRPSINLNSAATLGGAYAPSVGNWGKGQICHNRNTGRLLVAQPIGGSSGSYLDFRLHIFDLQMKISRTTTIAQLRAAMIAACVTGANRYRYQDVRFSHSSCYFNANTNYDIADAQFVLCDNDDMWMMKPSNSANTGASYSPSLFRVNVSGGTWFNGTYTATFVLNLSDSNVYGNQQSDFYSAKHMNSDDNSVIALFQHYYYYCCGCNIFYVSTKSAWTADYNYQQQAQTNYFYSIAPAGGPNFVLSRTGAQNMDGPGCSIGFVCNETLSATGASPSYLTHLYPVYGASTSYGVSNIVLKVQPTSEWK